ncbi:MAG: hypothetical protein V1766_11190 [Pseudomonadota bacterium]
MDKLSDPLFWTTILATLVNVALYRINRKTFRLLDEKPKIVVRNISLSPRLSDGMGGFLKDTFIELNLLNPSSSRNLIISRKLRPFPFGSIIDQGDANIEVPAFSRSNMHISLNYDKAITHDKKPVLLTLLDIKGRKIHKLFRLKNTDLH